MILLKRRVYLFLAYRILKENNILFNTLGFIFISFRFLYSYIYKPPFTEDFPYRRGLDYSSSFRWPIDIYRATGYAI
jgi:hypothetical protein